MKLAGVAGRPVGHSRSPEMHNAAFRELGLDWLYVRVPVGPDLFEETVRALPASGFGGLNVTIPHKEAALALADEASPAAAAIGAANTLVFADGGIRADNTDAAGLIDSLEGSPAESPAGSVALVLGAGGAARAAAWALREAGAEVSVWNRTPQRAARLAADLGVRHARRPETADVVVNATAVGLDPRTGEGEALEALGLESVQAPPTFVDLVYGDAETPLCAWARRRGSSVVDGLEVLVRQGARSFWLWTGCTAPVKVMRDVLPRR